MGKTPKKKTTLAQQELFNVYSNPSELAQQELNQLKHMRDKSKSRDVKSKTKQSNSKNFEAQPVLGSKIFVLGSNSNENLKIEANINSIINDFKKNQLLFKEGSLTTKNGKKKKKKSIKNDSKGQNQFDAEQIIDEENEPDETMEVNSITDIGQGIGQAQAFNKSDLGNQKTQQTCSDASSYYQTHSTINNNGNQPQTTKFAGQTDLLLTRKSKEFTQQKQVNLPQGSSLINLPYIKNQHSSDKTQRNQSSMKTQDGLPNQGYKNVALSPRMHSQQSKGIDKKPSTQNDFSFQKIQHHDSLTGPEKKESFLKFPPVRQYSDIKMNIEDQQQKVESEHQINEETKSFEQEDELNNTQYLLNYDYKQVDPDLQFGPYETPEQKTKAKVEKKVQKKTDFIMYSANQIEPYTKRAIQKLGWFENSVSQTTNFHIKFDIIDKEGQLNKLKSQQWYNHFPNNRELTTKSGLCKNLWFQCPFDYELQVQSFFPRCYDLSDQKQIDLFVDDFKQTAIVSIVKQFACYFEASNHSLLDLYKQYTKKKNFIMNKVYKQNFKLKCSRIDQMKSGQGFLLGNDILRTALQYCKHKILKKVKVDRNCLKNKHKNKMTRKFTEDDIQELVEYNTILLEKGIPLSTIPVYEQIKTYRIHMKLQKELQQYSTIDGYNNVWVVKPSFNARGLGVYCTNKLKDILKQGNKTQPKIVQKYIENPFLVNKKKFDIRQWVLVTSWDPLEFYVFSGSYLKICGSQFKLEQLNDQFRHLSNYSLQKTNKQFNTDDLVMSNQQFEEYLQVNLNKKHISWEKDIFPQIQDLAFKTLKGVSESMEARSSSFEIYGFDIIFDENLKPWLIEANLSPACNERTDWLKKMVDDMSFGLVSYLEQKIILSFDGWETQFKDRKEQLIKDKGNIDQLLCLNDEQFYAEHCIEFKWMKNVQSFQEAKSYQQSNQFMNQTQPKLQLEAFGTKFDYRQDKKIEIFNKKVSQSQLIQRAWRGYCGRQLFTRLLKNKSSILIQKFLRKRIAQNVKVMLQKNKSSVLVQRYLRGILARKLAQRMEQERINAAKFLVAIRIQSHYRRKLACKIFQKLFKNKKAIVIQKYLRSYITQVKTKHMLIYKTNVIRIQKFFKRRFKLKKKSSIMVQKYLKGLSQVKKFKKLLKIKKGFGMSIAVQNKKKTQEYFQKLFFNLTAIKLQSFYRTKREVVKYRAKLKLKSQMKLQYMLRAFVLKLIKAQAKQLNNQINKKASLIQKVMRGYIGKKHYHEMKILKIKNDKALLIQRFLRRFNAQTYVEFRRIQLQAIIILQAFARQIIAKKLVKKKRQLLQLKMLKKKKELSKNFQQKKKAESQIEEYIESLFHKEVSSQQKNNPSSIDIPEQNKHRFSQKKQSQKVKDMYKNLEQRAQVQQDNDLDYFENNQLILAESVQRQNEDPASITTERNQKQLIIKKGIKGNHQTSNIMTNLSTNKGNKGQYYKEMSQKIGQNLKRVKNKSLNRIHSSQNGQAVLHQRQVTANLDTLQKPKNFAENLMNMLAKQKMGQVFSENPVQALNIINTSQGRAPSKNKATYKNGELNLNSSQVNMLNTSLSQKASFNQAQGPTTYTSITIDSMNQAKNNNSVVNQNLAFPKLQEFKHVTNNIYLMNRPVQDPRMEVEYQQVMQEESVKQKQASGSKNFHHLIQPRPKH